MSNNFKPVIAIAGLGCETSTFSPARTQASAFHPRRGDEILEKYGFLQHGSALDDAAEWRGTLVGHALPGGVVTRQAFDELAGEIVDRLKRLVQEEPLDGLWYDVHGAMVVEGLDDCEAELLGRIIAVVRDCVVSTSMDLHGNVSRQLAHQTDLITCYRTAPQVDVVGTKRRACRNLVELLDGRQKSLTSGCKPALPLKAWVPIPVLLAGEQTSTRVEPAQVLYAAVPEVEACDGVIDAAVWVGYAWADEPRNHAAVVVTGWDEGAVERGAEKLASLFWKAHRDFSFVAPTGTLSECLDVALSSKARPYLISDSGDNPTAGGAGDVTWTLNRVLDRREFKHATGPKVVYASIPGPNAVGVAVEAGVGSIISVTAGAEVDDLHSGPITMTGRVHAIKHGDPHAEIEVVLQVGNVFVILTKLRKPYHHEHEFTDLNLDLRNDIDIVIVKIGYLEPELYAVAKDWMMALTPGGVDQDLVRLGHKRIQRPMWPFDQNFEQPPNLKARLIAPSNEQLTDAER